MSADFTKILVKDDRLEVVDNIKYAVMKGGQNVTMAQYKAISESDSQLVFNIQVPSEQTIIDRRVLLQTDLTLTVVSKLQNWTEAAAGRSVQADTGPSGGCGYGQYASLAPYPLHQLLTVASATINNNTVSINIRDVLPFIIRALDKGELNAYNGMTGTSTDSFLKYSSGAALASNSLGGGVPTLNTDMVGRGSIYLKDYSIDTSVATYTTEVFTFHISEPLMISPFIYCNPKSNSQGFYGIQNMNIVLNVGDTSRVFRGFDGVDGLAVNPTAVLATARYGSPAGAVGGANGTYRSLPIITSVAKGQTGGANPTFQNTFLLFTFLTPHPSDLMPARNIVPYYELPRYITTASTPEMLLPVAKGVNSILACDTTSGKATIISQTLQLNQIPDRLVLMIRKPMGSQSFGDSDSFLPIRRISINFNNNSGILSAARCEDLYRMSKDNGSNQNWNEFVGVVNTPVFAQTATNSALPYLNIPVVATSILSAAPQTTIFNVVPTCGSCLMLEFGKDIQLIEDFFASGSLGNFNIQVQVTVDNYNASIGANVELVMITMNSGVFVCERGTSSTYTGILTRADVLEASEQDAYSHADVRRMVGGGFLDRLKSGVSKLAPLLKAVAPAVAPMAKEYLSKKGSLGKLASEGISALGYGRSGGGPSGGGPSGGALHGRYM
jgi:hypothetical protein